MDMQAGVYRKVAVSGRGQGGGIGELYQFLLLTRDHYNGAEGVVYVPLRIEPEWAGTLRCCYMPRLRVLYLDRDGHERAQECSYSWARHLLKEAGYTLHDGRERWRG